jgi:hypothetical protein
MQFENFSFCPLQIDGSTYERDVIIDRGEIRKRLNKPSKKFREDFGRTPLSVEEDIPWNCTRLVVGTGAYGRLSVMKKCSGRQNGARSSCLFFLRSRPSRPSGKTPTTPMRFFT